MLSDALDSLGTVIFTRTRRAVVGAGFDSHGRALAPTLTTSTSTGMMQPLGGREIERLPEGLHGKEVRAYFSKDALTVPDSDTRTDGDHLTTADSVVWEVQGVEDWTAAGGFFRYLISRVDA